MENMMKAVILAGGLGTRLRGHIADIPKPMAPIAGRPFLEYVLTSLISSGISEITLSVGYRGDVIIKHFGNSYHGAKITYAMEDKPLGTGGAIQHALKGEKTPTLVLNGDTMLTLDYHGFINWYQRSPSDIAMTLRAIDNVERYGTVKVNGENVIGFEEKSRQGPGLINAGVYIVDPPMFAKYKLHGQFSFEVDLLLRHCATLRTRAYITNGYFIDIGIPSDFDRAQLELPKLRNWAI